MVKFAIAFILIFTLSGCNKYWHSKIGWAKPSSLDMELDYGPELYRQGYKDGCESGWKGYGNNFNKLFFKWRQDPILAQNPVYYRIWKDAYSYCAYYGMIHDEHGLGNWR